MALANLSIYYTWKNIKSEYNNNRFKIHAPTWNDTFCLPDGSYSISDIQDYFEYIIKKHETIADNPPVQNYLLSKETMQLLGSSKNTLIKTNIVKLCQN